MGAVQNSLQIPYARLHELVLSDCGGIEALRYYALYNSRIYSKYVLLDVCRYVRTKFCAQAIIANEMYLNRCDGY